jgi:hypothetical protein
MIDETMAKGVIIISEIQRPWSNSTLHVSVITTEAHVVRPSSFWQKSNRKSKTLHANCAKGMQVIKDEVVGHMLWWTTVMAY